jgi:hypothetical protein
MVTLLENLYIKTCFEVELDHWFHHQKPKVDRRSFIELNSSDSGKPLDEVLTVKHKRVTVTKIQTL